MKNLIVFFCFMFLFFSCKKNKQSVPSGSSPQKIGKPGPIITDVEGNAYKTVYIGSQHWMAENLRVSKYNDGAPVSFVSDDIQWSQLNIGAWCYCNNDSLTNAKYGKLYNWFALNSYTNGNKNVCPTGWHVPNDAEWKTLTDYLGGDSIAGSKMKEQGVTSWNPPNIDATNDSYFTGLPAGFRSPYGNDGMNKGDKGFYWSSSQFDTLAANLSNLHPLAQEQCLLPMVKKWAALFDV